MQATALLKACACLRLTVAQRLHAHAYSSVFFKIDQILLLTMLLVVLVCSASDRSA